MRGNDVCRHLRVLMQQLTFVCFALPCRCTLFFICCLFYCPFYGHSIENLGTLEEQSKREREGRKNGSAEAAARREDDKKWYTNGERDRDTAGKKTVRSITLSILVRHSFYLRYIFTKWSVMLFSIYIIKGRHFPFGLFGLLLSLLYATTMTTRPIIKRMNEDDEEKKTSITICNVRAHKNMAAQINFERKQAKRR